MSTEPHLPDDLTQRGFTLIVRGPGRMFAVSRNWGGTKTCDNLADVIRIAREMVRWCEFMNRKRAERAAHIET